MKLVVRQRDVVVLAETNGLPERRRFRPGSVESGSFSMPLGAGGSERGACRAEAAVEQQLREQAAEGVADDDRCPVERADDPVVVVDDGP